MIVVKRVEMMKDVHGRFITIESVPRVLILPFNSEFSKISPI